MYLPWKSTELGTDYARDWRGGFVQDHATNRPTVLVETEDGVEALALWRALGQNGFRMQWCPGPDRDANRRCSLVNSGSCPLVEHADVVLSHLDFTCEAPRETLAALRKNKKSAAPVLVAAPSFVRARYPEVTGGSTLIPDYLTSHRVVSAVKEALTSGGTHEAARSSSNTTRPLS